ncbi:hypothetical protein AB0M36_29690 [Actinoplanes sp. NPDC051346]|uniref:three-helix bundle dimerization domain-containing protein n=1 Tax=Actinoplanes sp. NPDC051346 TaxID=3155048 RepID=UPI0034382ED5
MNTLRPARPQRAEPYPRGAAVAEYVHEIYRRYEHAPIRDFLPLLVEREAIRGLSTRSDGDGPRLPAPR